MNVFDFALKMEVDGKSYYEKLAAATSVAELKNIFTLLAESEQDHHDQLLAMKNSLPAEMAESKALDSVKNVFEGLLKRKNLLADLKKDQDGYEHVVKEEEKSIKLYEELAAKVGNEAVRGLLLRLAEEEKRHLSIMENIYEFVERPGTYLAWGEFSNLKEF